MKHHQKLNLNIDEPLEVNVKKLALSLPEYLMEYCKVTLTFESADEILWCDHSNETSPPILTHGATYFSKFQKMKFGNLVKICFWLNLAVKGLKYKEFLETNMEHELPSNLSWLKSHFLNSLIFKTLNWNCSN